MAQFATWDGKIWLIDPDKKVRYLVPNPDQRETKEVYGNVRDKAPHQNLVSYNEGNELDVGFESRAVNSALTDRYTYQELFAPGQWHSDEDAAYRSSLVGTPKPLDPNLLRKQQRGEYADPKRWQDDPQAVSAVQNEKITLIGADIAEEYTKLQEEALADIGVFYWDEDQAREDALAIIAPFFEGEFKALDEDIKEQRQRSIEDYTASLREVTERAKEELKRIDITEAENETDLLARLDAIGGREEYEKAEQGRIAAEAAERLQSKLEDIRGTEGYSKEKEERLISKTQEELTAKLGSIGAREEYSYDTAKRDWEKRLAKEEETQLKRGRGFSGVMREEMGNLITQKGADLGEILRGFSEEEATSRREARYTTEGSQADISEIERRAEQERQAAISAEKYTRLGTEARTGEIGRLAETQRQEAQTGTMFTRERTQAAREEVEAQKSRGVYEAQTEMRRGIRSYGYGGDYENIPEEIRPAEPIPERGVYGERAYQEKGREKNEATLAQVNKLLEQRREEYSMARKLALEGVPEYSEYYGSEFSKRKDKYGL